MWLQYLNVAQLLRIAACSHTNQSRSYLNHLVLYQLSYGFEAVGNDVLFFSLLRCAAIERIIGLLIHVIHSLQSNINTDMIQHQLILSGAFDVFLACSTNFSEVVAAAIVIVVRLQNYG